MELPKNVTQIGESNHSCKIYVEDYVISYIKQLNGHALDKETAVALYGVKKEEAGIVYLFLYGACKLIFLQRESRHLSQAVLQEAEKNRKKYFSEYEFLGYVLLNGEMVEGFHVYEQGTCRYIAGYAQFYEKNDSMLRFMVAEREEAKPEEFNQEKYEVVRQRQEERRQKAEELAGRRSIYRERERRAEKPVAESQLRRMKMTAAAVFALLCVTGIAAMGGGDRLKETFGKMFAGISEQRLPDVQEVSNGSAQVGSVVTEDRLTDAIRKENEANKPTTPSSATEPSVTTPPPTPGTTQDPSQNPAPGTTQDPTQDPTPGTTQDPSQNPTPGTTQDPTQDPAPGTTQDPSQDPAPGTTQDPAQDPKPDPAPAPVSYTVKRGDTLIGICLQRYGSDARVAEICELNNISNPDDIKIGEKIMLPQ